MNIRKLKKRKNKKTKGFSRLKDKDLVITKSDGNIPFEKVSFFIHGYKKIGKSALCSQFKNPLFLTFDPPNESLEIDYIHIKTWIKFVSTVNMLVKDLDKYDYNYVVIDNVEKAHDLCMTNFLKKHGVDTPNKVASHGGGYRMIKKEFEEPLNKLLNSKFTLLATGHTVYKQITTPEGDDFHVVTCDGSKNTLDFFEKYLSTIMCFCYVAKNKKALRIRGGTGYNVDTHIDGKFRYTDGSPITTILMGGSKEEGYKNLVKAFNNELKKPKSKKSLKNRLKG